MPKIKRAADNEMQRYLNDKGVTDTEMGALLDMHRSTFKRKCQNPPKEFTVDQIKEIADFFEEPLLFFIEHIIIGLYYDEKIEIDDTDSDWDIKEKRRQMESLLQESTSEDARENNVIINQNGQSPEQEQSEG